MEIFEVFRGGTLVEGQLILLRPLKEGLKYNIAKTDEAKSQYYDIMIEEAQKMSKLIRDLLDLSSYDSGTISLSNKEIDRSVLLRESLEQLEPEVQKKKSE